MNVHPLYFFKIILLSFFFYTIVYPFFLSLIFNKQIKKEGHRRFLYFPNIIAGIVIIILMIIDIQLYTKAAVLAWKVGLVIVTKYSFEKEEIRSNLIFIPTVIGLYSFYCVYKDLPGLGPLALPVSFFFGTMLCIFIIKLRSAEKFNIS